MKDILKVRITAIIMTMLVAVGCSKHPETVVIGTKSFPEGVEISSTAYLFNSELATLAEKIKEIKKFDSNNKEIISGVITPSFPLSNDATKDYMDALNEVKTIYSSIPLKVKNAQADKISIEKAKIVEVQNKIDTQKALQAKLDNLTKAERSEITEIEQEIGAKEKERKQQKINIINAVNDYIVNNKLPIKKLDESTSNIFSWDSQRLYKGKCPDRNGRYYTEGTSHLSDCIYFNLGYKLRREESADELAKVVKAKINPYIEADWALKMTVGDKHGLYRKHKDAKKVLEQAVIIAENQTDISINTIKRTLSGLNRELERAKESLEFVNKYPVKEEDFLRENEEYSFGLRRMDIALGTISEEILKDAMEGGILVAKGPITGSEGKLPSTSGDYLMMQMVLQAGYRKENAFVFTNLNQEWEDKVYLDKDTAVINSSSSVNDDLDALGVAVVAMNRYQREHGTSSKGE